MITTPLTLDLVRGAAELETTARGVRPHRLPEWVRQQFPDGQLLAVESQPSGVRVAFSTRASRVALVSHPTRLAYRGVVRPRGRIDVFVDGVLTLADVLDGGDTIELDLSTGATTVLPGAPHTTVLEGLGEGEKLVDLWLPHNESIELVSLGTDAPVVAQPGHPALWVHHGSSISHGSNAAGPSETWPAVAARLGGVELRNLGVSGSALVDPFMARVIRDAPADVISVKLGINVVNFDAMRVRAFVPAVHGFLDTIRDAHPTTPLVLISPIFCGIHEHTPGPGAIDPASMATGQAAFMATGTPGDETLGRLTLSVIRRELRSLVERRAQDARLHYLDGTTLYGEADTAGHPLPDNLHPDTVTHRLIGERFASYAFGAAGPFSAFGPAESD
ncbi:GDSL-type esterase/lipase family protein [Subtercola vilae]|uniref:Lipase n=1 Tax=Subtercola vilae TaxID=2056433 RepID=A0A4T2C4E4_9MICO|nr:GDSL-type esterase/lipase family protein [Subtercola vilae]TIH38977.1 lipase [Subtercola vilae]